MKQTPEQLQARLVELAQDAADSELFLLASALFHVAGAHVSGTQELKTLTDTLGRWWNLQRRRN